MELFIPPPLHTHTQQLHFPFNFPFIFAFDVPYGDFHSSNRVDHNPSDSTESKPRNMHEHNKSVASIPTTTSHLIQLSLLLLYVYVFDSSVLFTIPIMLYQ